MFQHDFFIKKVNLGSDENNDRWSVETGEKFKKLVRKVWDL